MTFRRTSALVAALVPALLSALVAAPPSSAAPATQDAAASRHHTRVVLTVADCEGCEVTLRQARRVRREGGGDVVRVWASRTREVEDGRVTFFPATRRTHGMVTTVRAPWEGHTGYWTTVVWRYGGEPVGEPVTLDEALAETHASGCWEGTRRRRVVLPLVVEEVRVRGVHGMVPGSVAFSPVTQSWLRPVRRLVDGVLGSQDIDICR